MPSGYSGTPLIKKLGIKPFTRALFVGAPKNYGQFLGPLPEGVSVVTARRGHLDFVHLFTTRRAELKKALPKMMAAIFPDGVIWVSWPKKVSKVETDITEDVIRDVALPLGLVDIKVCAVDETWSGLKLVVRKEKRR